MLTGSTCQRACIPTVKSESASHSNVPMNAPTCRTACQCFNLASQLAKRRASFSNIPLTKCYRKFLYSIIIKNSTLYLILQLYIYVYDASYIKIVFIYLFIFNLFIVDKFYFTVQSDQPSTNSKACLKHPVRLTALWNVIIVDIRYLRQNLSLWC